MKKSLILMLSLIGMVYAVNASAWTCTHEDWKASECCPIHPNDSYCQQPPATTPGGSNSNSNENSNTNSNSQNQGQLQGQLQGQSSNNTNTNTANGGAGGQGGNASATGGKGGDAAAYGGTSNSNSTATGGNSKSNATGGSASIDGVKLSNGSSSESNASSGGNTLASKNFNSSSTSADNSGGNSATNVDASDHSVYNDESSFTVLPPVVPATPPAMLGVGQISTSRSSCGPQQVVVESPVHAYYFGFFRTKQVDGGYTESLQPAELAGAPNPFTIITYQNGEQIWLGSQVIVSSAVIGTAGGRNLALGGGSGSGNWGQAGGGASSSMQRLVTTITVAQCVYARVGKDRVVYKEVPAKKISQ